MRRHTVCLDLNSEAFALNLGSMDEGDLFFKVNTMMFFGRSLRVYPVISQEMLEVIFSCLGFDGSLKMLLGFNAGRGNRTHYPFVGFKDKCKSEKIENIEDMARETVAKFRFGAKGQRELFLKYLIVKIDDFIKKHESGFYEIELEQKVLLFSQNFSLTLSETELLRLLLMMRNFRAVDNYFDSELDIFSLPRRRILAAILDTDSQGIQTLYGGTLFNLEIVNGCGRNSAPSLDDSFDNYLDSPNDLSRSNSFVRAIAPQLNLEDHFVDNEVWGMMLKLLSAKSDHSTHILFYGPPGVGKTQLARSLANAAGVPAYEVLPEGAASGHHSNHRSNLLMASNFTRHGEGSIVIVDEADDLLNTGWSPLLSSLFGQGPSSKSKSWLDHFMDQPGNRCIWIANDIGSLEQSVKRRFSYSLHFPRLGWKEREKIWHRSKVKHQILGSERLSLESIEILARKFAVSAGVIDLALRKSLEAGPETDAELMGYLGKNLRAYLELSGLTADAVKVNNQYRLAAINTSPPAMGLLPRITNWRDWNVGKEQSDRRGMSLLLHGLPGTGKSELGRYLARHLDLELMERKASDILAPYVGESERNVAEMFREAEARRAILLVDEVESFFHNRDKAHRTWEVSLVNEFLCGLENFSGLFIGSTNRLNDLDPAAMRRFTQKVEFEPLNMVGRLELYQAMLVPLSGTGLTAGEQQLLENLVELTPGDFKVASDLFRWYQPGTVNNLELIEALKGETGFRQKPTDSEPQTAKGTIN